MFGSARPAVSLILPICKCFWLQVFVPKEELSLDVIKQYTVVSAHVALGTCGLGSTHSICDSAYAHPARLCQLMHTESIEDVACAVCSAAQLGTTRQWC